jgi:hypothetical protein
MYEALGVHGWEDTPQIPQDRPALKVASWTMIDENPKISGVLLEFWLVEA